MKVKNLPIGNPHFLKNFRKSVAQLTQKNRIIEEFQQEDERENKEVKLILGKNKENKKPEQQPQGGSKLFGAPRFSVSKSSVSFGSQQQQKADPLSFPIV